MVALEDIAEPADTRSPHKDANDQERDRAVRRAVDALPPKYREALILFYFQEMDVPATARSLNLPEGTVKARLFRARALLRSKLPSNLGVAQANALGCPRESV